MGPFECTALYLADVNSGLGYITPHLLQMSLHVSPKPQGRSGRISGTLMAPTPEFPVRGQRPWLRPNRPNRPRPQRRGRLWRKQLYQVRHISSSFLCNWKKMQKKRDTQVLRSSVVNFLWEQFRFYVSGWRLSPEHTSVMITVSPSQGW